MKYVDAVSCRIRSPLFVSFIEHTNYDPRYRRVYRTVIRREHRRLKRWLWGILIAGVGYCAIAGSASAISIF